MTAEADHPLGVMKYRQKPVNLCQIGGGDYLLLIDPEGAQIFSFGIAGVFQNPAQIPGITPLYFKRRTI